MKSRRTKGCLVLSLLAVFFLAACGGGDGGGESIPLQTPVVTTGNATGVTNVGATLNGTVNPNGLATEAWFEWGTSSTLSTSDNTAKQNLAAGTSVDNVSASISGLSIGTTYYFRMVASNSSGESRGAIGNFSTSALRPTVTTLAADNLAVTSATLHGEVNPNSLATQAWFEYGTDSTLATIDNVTPSVNIGSGSAVVPTSANIIDLIPGGTFYFRAAASNAAGEQKGDILTFSTFNIPPVPNAGPDNTVEMGQTVTLNGSGTATPPKTITSYLWTQVAGTPQVLLIDNTTAHPTFTAPTVPVAGAVLRFQLTVTDSGSLIASDNVDITVKWVGRNDNFNTGIPTSYVTTQVDLSIPPDPAPPLAQFIYDSIGQRAQVITEDDRGFIFSDALPATNTGVFSLDFYPTATYPSGGGTFIRLMQDADNYYEIRAFQWDNVLEPGEPSRVVKFVGGVEVQNSPLANVNNYVSQPSPTAYHITVTFAPAVTTFTAFGETITLDSNPQAINVDSFEIQTNQQDAYYDNIKLLGP